MLASILLASTLAAIGTRPPPAHANQNRPNILLILTDDQRFDELDRMPVVQSQLIADGVNFTNGLVSDPLCCPSRTTILTGAYSHTTDIYTNANDTGGFRHFRDGTTIATRLQEDGYRTGLIGKYMNGYQTRDATYVPPGWDRWFALTELKYFNFSVSDQGSLRYIDAPAYQTDVLGQQAVDFIESTPSTQPVFLYWAPYAPHGGARPAPKYQGTFSGIPPLRPPSYNEADVSDKPAYIRGLPVWDKKAMKTEDKFRQHQYECLLSVDDWVGSILQALADSGRLQNTLVVFMSDNGHPLGEHRLGHPGRAQDKASPYEESLRVPFIVRWDAAGWSVPRTDTDHIVANVDLADTFAHAAGTTMPGTEGTSMLPILGDPSAPWRTDLLAEHAIDQRFIPTYCAVRGTGWDYVQYQSGEEELYDTATDPYELQNLANDDASSGELSVMRQQDHVLCTPTPPGFTWHH